MKGESLAEGLDLIGKGLPFLAIAFWLFIYMVPVISATYVSSALKKFNDNPTPQIDSIHTKNETTAPSLLHVLAN